MQVRVVPPDPDWPRAYDAEARRLRDALGDTVIALHHIGSTAIRGIHAKPIIDILLEVGDLGALDRQTQQMQALGYEAKGEFGIPGRRYFRRDSAQGVRTHQVHAFERGSHGARRHLAFRDHMNAHPEAAQAYDTLKRSLAARFPNDLQAYMDGKDAFVKRHEALALGQVDGHLGAIA